MPEQGKATIKNCGLFGQKIKGLGLPFLLAGLLWSFLSEFWSDKKVQISNFFDQQLGSFLTSKSKRLEKTVWKNNPYIIFLCLVQKQMSLDGKDQKNQKMMKKLRRVERLRFSF